MLLPICKTESTREKQRLFDGVEGDADSLIFAPNTEIWSWRLNALNGNNFAFRQITGDFILCVQIDLENQNEVLGDSDSLNFGLQVISQEFLWQLGVTGKGAGFQSRDSKLELADTLGSVNVFQVERSENQIVFSVAIYGQPLLEIKRVLLSSSHLDKPVRVGVFNANHAIKISNIRYTVPAWKNLVPYQDYLGSRLELLDPQTGERQVIFQTYAGIEAPNWTPDGENILFNSAGRIFRFNLASDQVTQIDTGFALRNNNDHVLSPDGKWLGISHHSQDHNGKSIVYKLPAKGGTPIPLTNQGPSFLHGWSPDGLYVIYTAHRNGQWDIYRVPTDGSGDEIRLTNNNALDDGSEYSSDGEYIYFNSTRTGTMQIWRMKSDGSDQEQITFDEFQDWFPHLSPDGKTLVFISYQPDMEPSLHPYYQKVYLRSLTLEDAINKKSERTPKIIAYLYGGQGTINVPSWSPNGKVIAFVSHTKLREQ